MIRYSRHRDNLNKRSVVITAVFSVSLPPDDSVTMAARVAKLQTQILPNKLRMKQGSANVRTHPEIFIEDCHFQTVEEIIFCLYGTSKAFCYNLRDNIFLYILRNMLHIV